MAVGRPVEKANMPEDQSVPSTHICRGMQITRCQEDVADGSRMR